MKIFLKKSQVVSEEKESKLQKAVQTSHKLIRKSYGNFHTMLLSTYQENFHYVWVCLLCYEIMMQLNFALPKDKKGLLLVGNLILGLMEDKYLTLFLFI